MEEAVKRTIQLYSNIGWKSIFTRIRFWDAPYAIVEKLVPQSGIIVDLGCGEGIFSNFLAISSNKREVIGIELDEKRIKVANRGVSNALFRQGDANKTALPKNDCVIIFHVLHHLESLSSQERIIDKCIKSLKDNGKLIIVEIEPKLTITFITTWFTDHFLVPWIFERKIYSPIFFRKSNEWLELLIKHNLKPQKIMAEKGKPFSHVIITAQKEKM